MSCATVEVSMAKNDKLLISCMVAALFAACGCSDKNNSCESSEDCGDTNIYMCNLDGVCVEKPDAHCNNQVKDADESDIDCGGAACAKCVNNKKCNNENDCGSGYCNDKKVCTPMACDNNEVCSKFGGTCDFEASVCVTCSDGIKNGEEPDVDCGGTCSTKCEGGKACNEHKDCVNGFCDNNVCSKQAAETADPNVLVINEVFDSSASSEPFPLNDDHDACEFIEIANTSDKSVKVDGLSIEMKRTDDEKKKTTNIPLSGVIPAKNLLVVHTCDADDLLLPEDALSLWMATQETTADGKTKISRKFSITSTATYEMAIVSSTARTEPITVDISATKNKTSYNRNPEFNADGSIILSTSLEGAAFASPGYCMNGGTYSNNCQDGIPLGGVTLTACSAGGAQCTAEHFVCSADKDERDSSGYCIHECYDSGDCDAMGDNWGCFRFEMLDPNFDPDNFDPDSGEPGICVSYENKFRDIMETDVDCGCVGCKARDYEDMPAEYKCGAGKSCKNNEDCISGECTGGVCKKANAADLSSLIINEVMSEPKTSSPFDLQSSGKQCDFVEIINTSDLAMDLDGTTLNYVRVDEGHGPENTKDVKDIELTGTIPAKGAYLILGNCYGMTLPNDVNIQHASTDNFLTASPATYELKLVQGENMSETVTYNPAGSGYSANRETDRDPASALKSNKDRGGEYKNTPGYCDNGGIFSANCRVEDTCSNNEKDGTESDTDCGGKCAKCANGKTCHLHTDCDSSFCDFEADGIGVCAEFVCHEDDECGGDSNPGDWHCVNQECVKCDDGKKNGYETDTDCGGPHCGACDIGQSCKEPSDCISNECSGNICSGEKPQPAALSDLSINEVMGSPKSGMYFAIQTSTSQCEFIEIINHNQKAVSVDGILVFYKKATDTADKAKSIALSGNIPAKGVLVLSEKAIPMPSDGVNLPTMGSILTNGSAYNIWLADALGNTGSEVNRAALGSPNGKSQNRSADYNTEDVDLKWHDAVSGMGLLNSPGYCVNGGLFSQNCKTESSPVSKLFINEVMLSPKLSGVPFNPVQNINGCKFIEIVNLDADNEYDLDGLAVVIENIEDSTANKTVIPLEGSILANSAFVIWSSSCTTRIELPTGVQSMVSADLESVLMSHEWGISVESFSEDAPESPHNFTFIWEKKESGDGISETHDQDRNPDASIAQHTAVGAEGWNASPGYCINGGLFSQNCAAPTSTP